MPDDVKPAVEPSAPAIADGWDEHGTPIVTKKPEPPKKEEPAASATPAKEAKPEEKSAEPGAAKQEPKPKAKLTAEERISQLTADRKAAEERAEKAEARAREAEAKAQPKAQPKAEPPKPKEPPKRPNPFTWKGTPEEYEAAVEEYEKHRDEQVAARTRQEHQQSEAQKAMAKVVEEATTRHPDAKEKIVAATNEVMSDKTPFFVKAFINDSEVLGDLLYTLADQATLSNLLETAKANPGKALRVLRDMELDIQKALSKPPAVKPEDKEPEPKPRAPKPPSEVGGRGAATEDADKAAARDGNFAAFEAEQRRKQFKTA